MWHILLVAWVSTFDGAAVEVMPLTAHYNSPERCEAEAQTINEMGLVKIINNMEYVVHAVCQEEQHTAGARREFPA